MSDLADIKEKWKKDRPTYEELGKYVQNVLLTEVKKVGVYCNVAYRTKDLDKLLKKALRKHYSYERITDKLGLRVVLYFKEHLPQIEGLIESLFDVSKKEDKSDELGVDKWGYQGIHFDVSLLENALVKSAQFKGIIFEIQLQTQCQNVWCELNHELNYKSEIDMPHENVRSINRISALLETADIEFERTYKDISALPTYKEIRLLHLLEKHYFKFVARDYDRLLSLEILTKLCRSFDGLTAECYNLKIDEFVQKNNTMLGQVYQEYGTTPERSILLFQPEGLLILLLMDEDIFKLERSWLELYPIDELENLANICGKPMS